MMLCNINDKLLILQNNHNGGILFLDTCTCSTPGAGTVGKNELKCTNGETRHCSSDQECYATEAFTCGEWSDGCRIPICNCTTPGAGKLENGKLEWNTAEKNEITCSNEETRHCSEDQECYATDEFTYGEWSDGCRIFCECTDIAAGKPKDGNNQMKCSNGETRYCSSEQECYAPGKFTYGKWSDGCRIPGDWILRICKYFNGRC